MKKIYILLAGIVVVACLLRFWSLDSFPVSLFGDEIDVGYHAYSLLQTGKDYSGNSLPLYLRSLAEWRAPLFIYSTIPSIYLFGLNELGVRFSAALFGLLGVILIYFLGKKIAGTKVGLIAALLLSILPWHIHYSRAAFEVTLLVDLIMLGTICFLNGNKKTLVLSAIFFGLSIFTYSTAVMFTPLYIVGLYVYKKIKLQDSIIYFGIPFILFFIPFVYLTFYGPAAERYGHLSVFNSESLVDGINRERTENLSSIEKLFHNRPVGWAEVIASNYINSFSPSFLFSQGDPNPRHNVPGVGQLYWGLLPMFIFGLFYVFSKYKKEFFPVVLLLLLAPLPASLTVDGASHATRLFLMTIPLTIICSLGLLFLIEQKKVIYKFITFFSVILIIFNTGFYLHRYLSHYPQQQWKYWHYGYRDAMQTVVSEEKNFEYVFINNTYEPSLLKYSFWSGYSPESFHKLETDVPSENIMPGFNGFSLDKKHYFGETTNLGEFLKSNMLYLAAQGKEIPGDWDWEKSPPVDMKVIKVIRNPQGQPLFTLVTKK